MVRTSAQYRDGLRDGREVWIDGERVKDVNAHPALRSIVDIRARIYDMQDAAAHASGGQICVTANGGVHHGRLAAMAEEILQPQRAMAGRGPAQAARLCPRLLSADYAGHRLAFVQFAQAPHFNQLAAVYGAFDFSGPLDFVRNAAGLSDKVTSSP